MFELADYEIASKEVSYTLPRKFPTSILPTWDPASGFGQIYGLQQDCSRSLSPI